MRERLTESEGRKGLSVLYHFRFAVPALRDEFLGALEAGFDCRWVLE